MKKPATKKKTKISDPFAEREAEKYTNPIPSREYIMQYLRERNQPARREEFINDLQLNTDEAKEALRRRLRAMERDGQLIYTRGGGYGLPEKMDLIKGRVIGHRDGFGFVAADDGGPDLFLSARQMRAVFHGDRVLVHVVGIDFKGRREASIVEVLERAYKTIVGRFIAENGVTYVMPDNKRINQDILVDAKFRGGAKNGDIVVVEIIEQPTFHSKALGKVNEILGQHLAPGMEIDIAVRNFNIPYEWSFEVLKEIKPFTEKVRKKDLEKREDLRELFFVTIDGEDARDFDDAVYCEKNKKGWNLFVAIADVSHYVKPGTALDEEAYERGNSVYFSGEVIPMLPEILSNGLCSLKPRVDRLCMVCEINLNQEGEVVKFDFYRAVIHSKARLTYTEVTEMLEQPKSVKSKQAKELYPHLKNLHALFLVLHANREERGAIDFDTVETKVIFGENRKIEKIVPYQRTVSHRIIEECMLLANVCAAERILKKKMPALFRIHEGPSSAKLQDLREFLSGLGLRLPGGKTPKPMDYAKLLESTKTRPDAHLIQTVLLRSLTQAIYHPENVGHFGLGYDAYTHFTSPIRRYPDLLVHRALGHLIDKKKITAFAYDQIAMEKHGDHCSMTERRADDATRDVLDWLKCEFIKDKVGEEFAGIVTNITSFGLFVELQGIYVEGLVHVSALKNDYYHYDAKSHRLQGEHSGKVYRLGDKINVRVVRVDLDNRKIDFDLGKNSEKPLAVKDNKKNKKEKKRAQKRSKKRR